MRKRNYGHVPIFCWVIEMKNKQLVSLNDLYN